MNPVRVEPYVLIAMGIILFAFARFGTGSGYVARLHMVSQETPEIVLKAFAVVLWLVAAVWLLISKM